MNDSLLVLSGTFAEADSKDFLEALDNNETAEDYGYRSDSDLEDDSDHIAHSATGPLGAAAPLKDHPLDHPSSSTKDRKPLHAYGEFRERVQQGKVIKVQDIAFITHVSLPKQKSHHVANNLAGFRHFYSTYTSAKSSSRPTVPTRIAVPG